MCPLPDPISAATGNVLKEKGWIWNKWWHWKRKLKMNGFQISCGQNIYKEGTHFISLIGEC